MILESTAGRINENDCVNGWSVIFLMNFVAKVSALPKGGFPMK